MKKRTVFDIISLHPVRTVVACTWRSDFANNLLSKLITDHDHNGTGNCWTGVAMWREIEIPKELK